MKLTDILFSEVKANQNVRILLGSLKPDLASWAKDNLLTPNGDLRAEEKLVDAFGAASPELKNSSEFQKLRKEVLSQVLYFNRDKDQMFKKRGAIERLKQALAYHEPDEEAQREVEKLAPQDCNPERIKKIAKRVHPDDSEKRKAYEKQLITKYCGEQPETDWDAFRRIMTTDISDLVKTYQTNKAKRAQQG